MNDKTLGCVWHSVTAILPLYSSRLQAHIHAGWWEKSHAFAPPCLVLVDRQRVYNDQKSPLVSMYFVATVCSLLLHLCDFCISSFPG